MADLLKTLGDISSILGLIGAFYSVSIWYMLKRKEKFSEQRIKIFLKIPGEPEPFKLPYEIERKYLTRSELQGLLGILPMKKPGDRYQLSFLNTAEFFGRLKAAQDESETNSVEIVCAADEVGQFDIEKMREQCR